jgi:MscS family membrane protein
MVYFFFKVGSWSDELRERHNVFLEILRLAQDLGIEFAFPTQTLHLASAAQPEILAGHRVPETKELEAAVIAFGPGGDKSRPAGPKITHGFFATPSSKGSEAAAEDGG